MNVFKKSLILGLVSGILSGVVSLVFQHIYTAALGANFSKIVTVPGIFMACIFGSLLAAVGFWLFHKALPKYGEIVFNLVFSILTFASIIGPFAIKMPLDVSSPELFPGMVVPMHFFPVLAWFTLRPWIIGDVKPYQKIFS